MKVGGHKEAGFLSAIGSSRTCHTTVFTAQYSMVLNCVQTLHALDVQRLGAEAWTPPLPSRWCRGQGGGGGGGRLHPYNCQAL